MYYDILQIRSVESDLAAVDNIWPSKMTVAEFLKLVAKEMKHRGGEKRQVLDVTLLLKNNNIEFNQL